MYIANTTRFTDIHVDCTNLKPIKSGIFIVSHISLQTGTPPEEATDSNNNQPHVVSIVDADDSVPAQYYIAIEQKIVFQCLSLCKALYFLFIVHYVFNLEYHPRVKEFYYFMQDHLFKIKEAKPSTRSANYANVCSSIDCRVNL